MRIAARSVNTNCALREPVIEIWFRDTVCGSHCQECQNTKDKETDADHGNCTCYRGHGSSIDTAKGIQRPLLW